MQAHADRHAKLTRGQTALLRQGSQQRFNLQTKSIFLTTYDFFGERSLLRDEPVNANVRAVAFCDLLLLPADVYYELLEHHPELGRTMMLCSGMQEAQTRSATQTNAERGVRLSLSGHKQKRHSRSDAGESLGEASSGSNIAGRLSRSFAKTRAAVSFGSRSRSRTRERSHGDGEGSVSA